MSKVDYQKVPVDSNFVKAALQVPKDNKKELTGRAMIDSVCIEFGAYGDYRVVSIDGYVLVEIESGGAFGKCEKQLVFSREDLAFVKPNCFLTFQEIKSGDFADTYKVIQNYRGQESEYLIKTLVGTYPTWQNIIPSDYSRGHYGFAPNISAKLLKTAITSAQTAMGKKCALEFGTAEPEAKENECFKPIVGICKGDGIRFTSIIMPVRMTEKDSAFKKAKKRDSAKRIQELEEKIALLEADKRILQHDLDKAKIEKPKDSKAPEKPKDSTPKAPEKPKADSKPAPKKPASKPKKTDKKPDLKSITSLKSISVNDYRSKGGAFWIGGNTKKHADDLKALGFRYSSKRKAWWSKDGNIAA